MFKASTLTFCLSAAASAASAEPGYYLVTPYAIADQRTIDLRYWTVKPKNGAATLWPEIGFGLGINSRWTTYLNASFIGARGTATRLDTLNWQNDVLLTQGQYPLDVAMHLVLSKNRDAQEGYTIEAGPVLQTDIGRTQLNGNVFLERSVRASMSAPTQLKYQWQVKHRWRPAFQFGVQGFGEVGPWDHWAPRQQQSHRVGPMLSGTLPANGQATFGYQAALLLGSTYGQDGNMFSVRVHYSY